MPFCDLLRDIDGRVFSVLQTYTGACGGQLSREQTGALSSYLTKLLDDKSNANLAERWGLSELEVRQFITRVKGQ